MSEKGSWIRADAVTCAGSGVDHAQAVTMRAVGDRLVAGTLAVADTVVAGGQILRGASSAPDTKARP